MPRPECAFSPRPYDDADACPLTAPRAVHGGCSGGRARERRSERRRRARRLGRCLQRLREPAAERRLPRSLRRRCAHTRDLLARRHDAARQDTALYPAFTATGTFSFAQIVDPSASPPFADVNAGDRSVARAYMVTGWAWSPRREEVAFGRLSADRKRLELVLASVTGAKRVLASSTVGGISWLPDGSGLVYTRRAGGDDVVTLVRRDGRGRRDLARNADSPLVSPDGKQVAFLRRLSESSIRSAVWVVPTRGGRAREDSQPGRRRGAPPGSAGTRTASCGATRAGPRRHVQRRGHG